MKNLPRRQQQFCSSYCRDAQAVVAAAPMLLPPQCCYDVAAAVAAAAAAHAVTLTTAAWFLLVLRGKSMSALLAALLLRRLLVFASSQPVASASVLLLLQLLQLLIQLLPHVWIHRTSINRWRYRRLALSTVHVYARIDTCVVSSCGCRAAEGCRWVRYYSSSICFFWWLWRKICISYPHEVELITGVCCGSDAIAAAFGVNLPYRVLFGHGGYCGFTS